MDNLDHILPPWCFYRSNWSFTMWYFCFDWSTYGSSRDAATTSHSTLCTLHLLLSSQLCSVLAHAQNPDWWFGPASSVSMIWFFSLSHRRRLFLWCSLSRSPLDHSILAPPHSQGSPRISGTAHPRGLQLKSIHLPSMIDRSHIPLSLQNLPTLSQWFDEVRLLASMPDQDSRQIWFNLPL